MVNVKVDLDDIIQKLNLAQEDGCTQVILDILGDDYVSELGIRGINPDSDDILEYGSVSVLDDDLA